MYDSLKGQRACILYTNSIGLLHICEDVGLFPSDHVIELGVGLCGFPVSTKAEAGESWSQCQACLACLVRIKAF